MAYQEIAMLEPIGALDHERYLAANPDVRLAGLDPAVHYELHGHSEGRRQVVDPARVMALREEKLSRVRFNRSCARAATGAFDVLSAGARASFKLPEYPPVAENDYAPELVDMIRGNPDSLFLDVGAGFRHVYYSNVVNAEIWAAPSTDVVCLGEDLPFEDGQFDHVFCLAVLEHTKRPWIAAQEIMRVLKPGGTIRIDWPFLQPIHGYPHHYYNATPMGLMSMFEDMDVQSARVRPWQHPIFTLSWFLNEWATGLQGAALESLKSLTVQNILDANPEVLLRHPFCQELGAARQEIIAAGTTLIATKRA